MSNWGYIYNAALWCQECGDEIKERLDAEGKTPADPDDEYTYDSDEYPKQVDVSGEADSPQHCDGCGKFLENSLTEDGWNYLIGVCEDFLIYGYGNIAEVYEWTDHYWWHTGESSDRRVLSLAGQRAEYLLENE